MLKNLIVISVLILGTSVFSFHKMEIYYDPKPHFSIGIMGEIYRFQDWKKAKELHRCTLFFNGFCNEHIYPIFFLYDKNTFIQLQQKIDFSKEYKPGMTIEDDLNFPEPDILKFLKCEFSYAEGLSSMKGLYFMSLENQRDLNIQKQGLCFKDNGTIVKIDNNVFNNENVYIQEYLKLYSGHISDLKIVNTPQGAILKGNGKEVSLTDALKSYFVKELDADKFAYEMEKAYNASFGILSEKVLNPILNLYHYRSKSRKFLNKEDYDRLQDSTILAVWYAGESYRNNKLVGLARHKNGEQYHWATDLGQPVSVLLNYEPKADNSQTD